MVKTVNIYNSTKLKCQKQQFKCFLIYYTDTSLRDTFPLPITFKGRKERRGAAQHRESWQINDVLRTTLQTVGQLFSQVCMKKWHFKSSCWKLLFVQRC